MIMIDKLTKYRGKRKLYAHMISDTSLRELHEFAALIGVKPHFFHRGDHYDIRDFEHAKALEAGAVLVDSRTLAKSRVCD